MKEFLEETEYVDFLNLKIQEVANLLKRESADEITLIKNSFYFVRDKIHHSYPDEKLMNVLKQITDAIDMYLHYLPDTLGYIGE